jgi:hypothetical protein
MEYLIIPNYKQFINISIGDWAITKCEDGMMAYSITVKKELLERTFLIRKPVIKANVLRLDNDVYELCYHNFQESKLLTLDEVLDTNIVVSKIEELLEKYSSYE